MPPKHLNTGPPASDQFDQVVNESARDEFQPFKQSTTNLIASGVFKGI